MSRVRVVDWVALVAWLIAALSGLVLVPAPGFAAATSSPLVLHLKWREVAANPTGSNVIATSERYVAIRACPGSTRPCTPELSVLDEQTGHQQVVPVPNTSDCRSYFAPVGFGGPYLALGCTGASHWLYDLISRQWLPVVPKCPADCRFVGVGRYWLKFDSNGGPGCQEHCGNAYYLQNLQTGRVEPDPAKPGGRILDDLDAGSGAVPLCAPLRYPISEGDAGQALGTLQFSLPFALASGNVYSVRDGLITVNRLERCGSRRAHAVENASPHFPPFISSRAAVSLGLKQVHCTKRPFGLACTNRYYVRGLYLNGMGRFAAALPAVTAPQYSWPGEVVGLTGRTIYVDAPSPSGPLWAATLPQRRTSHRQ